MYYRSVEFLFVPVFFGGYGLLVSCQLTTLDVDVTESTHDQCLLASKLSLQ